MIIYDFLRLNITDAAILELSNNIKSLDRLKSLLLDFHRLSFLRSHYVLIYFSSAQITETGVIEMSKGIQGLTNLNNLYLLFCK